MLRSVRHGSVGFEANLLRVLGRLGLPVPRVLAGPALEPAGRSMVVLSMLPGRNLQKFSMEPRPPTRNRRNSLGRDISAIRAKLFDSEEPIYHAIPQRTLPAQLQA